MFKTIFGLREMEKVHVTWQNKAWTKIITAGDWKKVKDQVVKQLSSKENEEFLRCLVIEIERQQSGW